MKVRKSKDIAKVLLKKGFYLEPDKQSHQFYTLIIDGKKHSINTFLSHSKMDYSNNLLSKMKKQLKFNSNENFELFLDCPFSYDDYLSMLKENGYIK